MKEIGNNKPPFVPFQYGPRTCLGMRMALTDLEACIPMLVRNFEFSPGSEEPVPTVLITLCVDSMMLKIKKRT